MKKSRYFASILSLMAFCVLGQSTPHRFVKTNSVQVELSGAESSLIPFSLNYERILLETKKFALNAKVGGIYKYWGDRPQKALTGEFGIIGGIHKHHWEAGVFTMWQDRKKYHDQDHRTGSISPPFYLAARGGYRFQSAESRWLFRAGIIFPFIKSSADGVETEYTIKFKPQYLIIPWPVIAVGRAF